MESTKYSRAKIPPVPILNIKLSPPSEAAKTESLSAMVDTGSDFTLVPLSWLLQINAPESRSAYLRGLWSERQLVTLYLVDLHLEEGVLVAVEVVGLEDEEEIDEELDVILGRNILNKLILLLDGPRTQTDVLGRRPKRF